MSESKRNQTIKRMIKRYTAANSASPAAARSALIKEGIYDSEGRLKPEFGGPIREAKTGA